MTEIIEKFTIPIYEYKTVDAGKNTIRIKGVALRGDVVSKNNRKYTREALMKATNTWIGKPINVNHNDNLKVGTIKWMDFDEASDSLLYEAEINRQPYVDMIRNRSTEIRGLSIQADYLHTVCARCGKRFHTEEDWYKHVTQEEFMKNMPTEPHGIVGSAISLVLSPEIPGYEGTTYELAEMARQATLRLLETVITDQKEKENYVLSRIALSSDGNMAVGKSSGAKALAEQEEEHQCPDGEHWDMEKQACVKDAAPEATEQEHSCPEGEHWSEEEGKCVSNVMEQEEHQCGEDEHWDADKEACVKNEPTPEAAEMLKQKIKPFKVAESVKLKLGEPFAGYDSFEDCVSKNSEKENPEAYCASIKKETEGEAAEKKATQEKLDELAEALNQLKMPVDDVSWLPRLSRAEQHLSVLTESVKALPINKLQDKTVQLSNQIAAVKPYNDKPLTEKINAIKPYDDTEIKQKIDEVATKIPQLEETLTKQVKNWEAAIALADKNNGTLEKDIAEMKKQLEDKDAKIEEFEAKKLKETTDLTGKLEDLTTKVENALDKQQGTFKGVAQKPKIEEKKANPDLSYKPGGKT